MTANISFEDVKYSRKQLRRMLKNTHALESINSTFVNLNSGNELIKTGQDLCTGIFIWALFLKLKIEIKVNAPK